MIDFKRVTDELPPVGVHVLVYSPLKPYGSKYWVDYNASFENPFKPTPNITHPGYVFSQAFMHGMVTQWAYLPESLEEDPNET